MENSVTSSINQDTTSTSWWLVLLQGVALTLFGLWLIQSPQMTLTVLVQILGAYWFIVGILHLIEIFSRSTTRSRLWLAISGFLGIIAGILALNNPLVATVVTASTLVILIGAIGLIMGIAGIARGLTGGGLYAFVLGLISAVISLYILFNPIDSTVALAFIIGTFAFVGGLLMVIFSITVRGQSRLAY